MRDTIRLFDLRLVVSPEKRPAPFSCPIPKGIIQRMRLIRMRKRD